MDNQNPVAIKHHTNYWGVALAVIAIALAVVLAFYVNSRNQHLNQQNRLLARQVTQQSKLLQTLTQSQQHLRSAQTQAQLAYQLLSKKLKASKSIDASDWAIVNAKYLGKLADAKLRFEHNTAAAGDILKTALSELKNNHSTTALIAKRAMASDIVALSNAPTVDTQAIYKQLNKLSLLIQTLPVKLSPKTQTSKPKTPTAKTWRDSLANSMAALKNLIVIRRDDVKSPVLMSPKSTQNLKQNLQLHLNQTQIALLRRNNSVYHDNLKQVISALSTYYDTEQPSVTHIITALTHLNGININPPLPNISHTLTALAALQTQGH